MSRKFHQTCERSGVSNSVVAIHATSSCTDQSIGTKVAQLESPASAKQLI